MSLSEVTTDIPTGLPERYLAGGSLLFAAYGCVLLERDTGKSYAYKAVNLENGRPLPLLAAGIGFFLLACIA